jgi:RNA polymerase-binding transcription factor DksA
LGADPSKGGKVVDMVKTLSADYSEPMSSPESTNEESTTLIDLDAIERDLADVEMALSRLDAGTYWVDEISGQPLPDAVLEANPLARRNPA